MEMTTLDELESIRDRHETIQHAIAVYGLIWDDVVAELIHNDRATLLSLVDRLSAELAEIREAAGPFAEEARKWANCIDGNGQDILIAHPCDVSVDSNGELDGIDQAAFTLGDLRRLAAALAKDATT
jgi:hypothetical protein